MKTARFYGAAIGGLLFQLAVAPATAQSVAPDSQAVWKVPSDASIHALLEDRMHATGA
jgi:hypothetical protein